MKAETLLWRFRGFGIAVPIFLISSVAQGSSSAPCAPLTDSIKGELVEYIQTKYHVPITAGLHIAEAAWVGESCYQKLRVEAVGHTAFSKNFYLSPDQRYLTTDLLDSRTNPLEEERRQNESLAKRLSEGAVTFSGPVEAPVTVVVFADFQCPYCKKAAELLRSELQTPEGKNVRWIYRNFPLPMHPWARPAAEAAACIGFQDRDAFWKMHNLIFDNQQTLTPANIGGKTLEFARAIPGVDIAAYQSCIDNAMSAGRVAEDIELATAIQVRGTPTIFVNGRRIPSPRSQEELHSAITEATKTGPEKRDIAEAHTQTTR